MLNLISSNIPEELREKKKWVAFEVGDGKKIPICPQTTSNASSSDPSSWGTFEEAKNLVENGLYPAVAYVMTPGDDLIFIDIDYHADKLATEEEKADLKRKYESMVEAVKPFNTYMEQSLSGSGVHLLARGRLEENLKTGSSPTMPLEIYGQSDKRFIIMTGHKLNDCRIEDSEQTIGSIQNLHKNYFKCKTPQGVKQDENYIPPIAEPIYSDDVVIQAALREKKVKLLWDGDWEQVKDKDGNQKFNQQHFADFALINKLTYYTHNCPTQVERLFKASPCFQQYGRDGKWEKFEKDIKADIKKASMTCLAVYSPIVKAAPPEPAGQVEPAEKVISPIWPPDWKKLTSILWDEGDGRVFNSPKLVSMLREYVEKNDGRSDIPYLPNLFKQDRNINGATNIVRTVLEDRLKYSFNFGDYYLWDGTRYKAAQDPEILIHPITQVLGYVEDSVVQWILDEVVTSTDRKDILEERAAKLLQDSKGYVSRALAQDVLKKLKGMSIGDDIAAYYGNPYLCVKNGVLNLETRELHPHAPKYNQTKIMGCDYDPTAQCSEFEAMVERIVPDKAVRKELQKACGLCLSKTQLPAKKALMLLIGPANTGKTTFLNTLLDVLGEYGTSVDNSLLMQSHKDKSRGPEMYAFRETLMITTSESNENDKLDAGKVKALTGNTPISTRNNYSVKMDHFKMIGLIFIDTNFKPYIPPRDTATWSRLRLFPFTSPVKEKDPTLKAKLDKEKAGILNWLLEGLDIVLEEKEIFETDLMLAQKEQYQKEMDTTQQFIQDCLVKEDDPKLRVTTSLIFTTYKNWCKDNGFKESVRNKFYEEIGKFFDRKKSNVEYFVGVRFSELGELYSKMQENSPQQFAKAKRELINGKDLSLPYTVVRKAHYQKSQAWFGHIRDVAPETNFKSYCDWCAQNSCVPLMFEDFKVKVEYIKSIEKKQPDLSLAEVLDMAEGEWSHSII